MLYARYQDGADCIPVRITIVRQHAMCHVNVQVAIFACDVSIVAGNRSAIHRSLLGEERDRIQAGNRGTNYGHPSARNVENREKVSAICIQRRNRDAGFGIEVHRVDARKAFIGWIVQLHGRSHQAG